MCSVSKNLSIDRIDYIFSKYSNTYHRTMKLKPVDVNSGKYIDFDKEDIKEEPKFGVGDNVRKTKCKKRFC